MKKIFFVGNVGRGSTFIDNDYNQLKKYFDVRYTQMRFRIKYVNLNFIEILKNVLWCDTVYGWFASYRMVLPIILAKIFHKKTVVVAGGYDIANAPEINYGAFIKNPDRRISKFVLGNVDKILTVSKYGNGELKESMPKAISQTVYNGVVADKWYPQGAKDEKLVMTTGEINQSNLKRKGLINFVKTAAYLPDVTFLLVGEFKDKAIKYLKSIATPNVKFTGKISAEELLIWYQRAKVYAQLSYHESFGVSVAEAMLCECIPVLSILGALPEVGGKNAYYVPFGDPEFTATVIERALKSNSGGIFRARVMLNFQLKKRINRLREIL